ncbi:MAG: response regulator [Myxococcaceae bacterium]|nr:response regulator [Myxococcaceae bacterium]
MALPKPKQILVVDDDPALTELLGRFLSKNGFEVVTAPDALQALQLLESLPDVALVITDLMMPHLDGIGFTKKLHELPGKAALPVIMVTAWTSDELADKGMRQGVGMTISKPIDLQKLLTLVGFATN